MDYFSGWGDWKNVVIPASPCGRSYHLSTYPNPASDVLKLTIRTTAEACKRQLAALATGKSKAVKERTCTVQLFGTAGNLMQQKKAKGDDIDLSFEMSDLPGGTYFVEVRLDGSGEEPQRVMVMVRK